MLPPTARQLELPFSSPQVAVCIKHQDYLDSWLLCLLREVVDGFASWTLRGTPFGEVALGNLVYGFMPGSLELGPDGSGCMFFPQKTPLLQCSPGGEQTLRFSSGRVSQGGPTQSRDRMPAHVWPCNGVQSWCAWVCIYFCSQECSEQKPSLVDCSRTSRCSSWF